jgi:hypothetical protein
MSSSGFYNYHPKVEHPNSQLYQMDSIQPSFFFGGSQVPINLHLDSHGSGFRTAHKFTYDQIKDLGDNRKFNKTTINKYNNIKLPKLIHGLKRL